MFHLLIEWMQTKGEKLKCLRKRIQNEKRKKRDRMNREKSYLNCRACISAFFPRYAYWVTHILFIGWRIARNNKTIDWYALNVDIDCLRFLFCVIVKRFNIILLYRFTAKTQLTLLTFAFGTHTNLTKPCIIHQIEIKKILNATPQWDACDWHNFFFIFGYVYYSTFNIVVPWHCSTRKRQTFISKSEINFEINRLTRIDFHRI